MKVQFLVSPGRFNLAYFDGDIAEVSDVLGQEMINQGVAVLTKDGKEEIEVEMMVQEVAKETMQKKKKK